MLRFAWQLQMSSRPPGKLPSTEHCLTQLQQCLKPPQCSPRALGHCSDPPARAERRPVPGWRCCLAAAPQKAQKAQGSQSTNCLRQFIALPTLYELTKPIRKDRAILGLGSGGKLRTFDLAQTHRTQYRCFQLKIPANKIRFSDCLVRNLLFCRCGVRCTELRELVLAFEPLVDPLDRSKDT